MSDRSRRDGFGKLGTRLKGLPPLVSRVEQRPIQIRSFALRPTGPRELRLGQVDVIGNGPGEVPPGFDGPTVSADEWVWYWASRKVLNPDTDPRQPPFVGDPAGISWTYQQNFRASGSFGGARIDFVYHLPEEDVGIRIQSQRYHTAASPEIKAYDLEQLLTLSNNFRVDDAYSEDFIEDPTGAAAIVELKRLLAGGNAVNPITAGDFRNTRIRLK